jgi:Outer membrane protein beta-barrel domain
MNTMHKGIKLSLILLLCCVALSGVQAQRRNKPSIFKAGLFLGVNHTQIDGDEQVGYHRRGFVGGVRGAIVLHPNFDIATELLYTQRGSQPPNTRGRQEKRIFIDLEYAEVPLMVRGFFPVKKTRHLHMDLYTGVSYARLLRYSIRPLNVISQTDTLKLNYINTVSIKTTDWSFIVGGSLYVGRRIGVSLRHTWSLTPFYNNPVSPYALPKVKENYQFFRSYYLTFGLFYDMVSAKPTKKKSGRRR